MADEIKKEETVAAAPEATEEKEYLKPAYQGEYDDKLKDLYTQMAARQPFQYNANEDALYQQYVDRYQQQGKQAMRDTIGQGTALTGGYTNSYAQNVGQQAYDSYLQGLNDKLSETYGLAMQAYQLEGDRLANLFSQTGALADSDYQRLMADAEARKGMGDKTLLQLLTGMPVTSGGGGVSYGGQWYGIPGPGGKGDGKISSSEFMTAALGGGASFEDAMTQLVIADQKDGLISDPGYSTSWDDWMS